MVRLFLSSACSQVPGSQASPAPTALAANTADVVSVGCSDPRRRGIIEPMDTDTQEAGRTSADQKRGGKKNTEADGKRQVDGRTQGDRPQATQTTQADRKSRVDTGPRESERPASARRFQEDAVAQGRAGTQVERTQTGRRMQEDRGTRSEESTPTAMKGQSEKGSVSSPGPQSSECFDQIPEGPSVPQEPGFVLRSEEVAVTAPGSYEPALLAASGGGRTLPVQRPPQGGLEQRGGPEWPGLVKDKPEDGLIPGPKEEQPREVPSMDLGGCPPAGQSPEAPTLPSPPRRGLTTSSREALPSTLAPEHMSAAAFPPSGDQALLRPAPALSLGPGTPTQSHPPAAMSANSEGSYAPGPDAEGRPPGPQSCDPGLIDSLKNYLLLLLKLSSAEPGGGGAEAQGAAATGAPVSSAALVPDVEVAGLSPRTSRRILERVENNHLVQSAQSLALSPCTSRRLTGLLDREVQAGRRALAAARGPGLSTLTVPAIVVGEEGGPGLASEGSSEGEGEGPPEGPGLPGASPESGVRRWLGETGGQTASGPGALPADRRAQEHFQEEEAPGEAPTGLPAATPEELALGARRKRFLPKVRAGGDGEAAKAEERESPTVSPRGLRKGLTPGSPGTPGREKRSPTQGRKAGMLEVPRAEDESAAGDLGSGPKANSADAEQVLDEGKQDASAKSKKAKDLLKGEQWGGWGRASGERVAHRGSRAAEGAHPRGVYSAPPTTVSWN